MQHTSTPTLLIDSNALLFVTTAHSGVVTTRQAMTIEGNPGYFTSSIECTPRSDEIPKTQRMPMRPGIDDVLDAVTSHFSTSRTELKSRKGARVRRLVAHIAWREGLIRQQKIAEHLGVGSYTTVSAMIKCCRRDLETDASFRSEADRSRIDEAPATTGCRASPSADKTTGYLLATSPTALIESCAKQSSPVTPTCVSNRFDGDLQQSWPTSSPNLRRRPHQLVPRPGIGSTGCQSRNSETVWAPSEGSLSPAIAQDA